MSKYLTRKDLLAVGGEVVAVVRNGEYGSEVSKEFRSREGFYFFVKGSSDRRQVAARFFVGRQRSKQGLDAILSHIRQGRSQLARTMGTNNIEYDVIFVAAKNMKPLTTGYGKGQLALAFTRNHTSEYQTLTEMNRLLADNFKFILQSY